MGVFNRKTEEQKTDVGNLSLKEQYGKVSLEAYKSNNWNTAMLVFFELEKKGLVEASVALGQMYLGDDKEKSLAHFKLAAEKGDAEAAWNYAAIKGHAYVPDITGADSEWYTYCLKAAKGGCCDAMNELGNIFNRQKKYLSAFYWYLMSAYYDSPDGNYSVGMICNIIQNNPKLNTELAVEGVSEYESNCAKQIFSIHLGNVKLDNTIMQELMSKALGDTEVMGLFIGHFFEGINMDGNAKMGYQVAANSESIAGMKCFGDMLAYGKGCEKDLSKAFGWYQAAAELGHPVAAFIYAQAFRSQKPFMAAYWFSVAYRRGYQPALQAIISL